MNSFPALCYSLVVAQTAADVQCMAQRAPTDYESFRCTLGALKT